MATESRICSVLAYRNRIVVSASGTAIGRPGTFAVEPSEEVPPDPDALAAACVRALDAFGAVADPKGRESLVPARLGLKQWANVDRKARQISVLTRPNKVGYRLLYHGPGQAESQSVHDVQELTQLGRRLLELLQSE